MSLTNDLNEKEDQIMAYKKREAAMLEHLAAKEKQHEQDNNVRLQLSKRLEQVMMDREDLKDIVENLKVRIFPFFHTHTHTHTHTHQSYLSHSIMYKFYHLFSYLNIYY